jgi:TPR repeat protein
MRTARVDVRKLAAVVRCTTWGAARMGLEDCYIHAKSPTAAVELCRWFLLPPATGVFALADSCGGAASAERQADVPRALGLLDAACSEGHPGAMFLVARCLAEGLGVGKNLAMARRWLEQAAALGYAPALCAMGRLLADGAWGDALPRNLVASLRCLRAAAEHGHGPSQLAMARLFLTPGDGLTPAQRDRARQNAMSWLQRAAAAGEAEAAALLQANGWIELPPPPPAEARPPSGDSDASAACDVLDRRTALAL